MPAWNPIIYREFWDQPRMLFTTIEDQTYLINCPFDEVIDEFSSLYDVYLMPKLDPSDLVGSWIGMETKAVRLLGKVLLPQSAFDSTRRAMIDLDFINHLLLA
jgi:hypothetical protein